MNSVIRAGLVVLAIIVVVIGSQSVFTVHQSEQALVLQLGRADRIITEPGLHFKIPLFIERIEKVSKRVLNIEAPADQLQKEIVTSDQKRVVVDYFARYRVVDPLLFYQSVRSELGLERGLEQRVQPIIASQLRRVLGEVEMSRILTAERAALMQSITESVAAQSTGFGIEVLDVRMKRVDLPPENSEAIYQRMQTQRKQEAAGIRAEGDREAQTLRAEADKRRVIIVADARRQAEIERGLGDAGATKIYNDAYNRDPAFFDFFRSMQALETSLPNDTTTYVGPPEGELFRYFGAENAPSPFTRSPAATAPAEPVEPVD